MTSATASSPMARITRPRLALLIMEGAASLVAAILLAWLLLWFIRQRSRELTVEAMYVAPAFSDPADFPFQAADVRALRGGGSTAGGEGRAAAGLPGGFVGDLAAAVRGIVQSPGAAVVVYVSAPVLGDGPDARIGSTSIRSLIETVVKEARRDVLLALDLAQVDSDRDLGVYGNDPYNGLVESVAQLAGGDRCVYVLTSAAPAQKSRGGDGLGQSVFAYFLREGLEGKARGWDAPESPGRISAEGLHRYVLRHVARWAKDHRNAVQTPMLLKIGDGARTVAFPYRNALELAPPPSLDASPSEARSTAPKAEPAAEKSEASRKTETAPPDQPREADPSKAAPPSPHDRAFTELLDEWRRHDEVLKRRPYHDLPETWRSYQAGLMRVERRLRAAWRVEGAIDAVDQEIREVGSRREQLEARLKELDKANAGFPLRPARGAEEGERAVAEALLHLTGAALDYGPFTAPARTPPPAKATPADVKDEKAAGNDPPRPLADALANGFPTPYLELQLPAWALRFGQEFAVPDHFKDDRRGSILRRLVEVRSRAEEALAVDRRGLDWIRPILTLGDDQRRTTQDQMFGPDPTDADGLPRFQSDIARFDRNYALALEVIQAYHDGRDAWERAAAELPELAEWTVRARAGRDAPNTPFPEESPLPAEVKRALDAAAALIDALDQPLPPEKGPGFLELVRKPVDDLRAATEAVQAAVGDLEKRLLESARIDGSRDWSALDAALRTPRIPVEARRRALEAILKMDERLELQADASTIAPAESAPDPGFWRLAAGLAALDGELRRISRADRRKEDSALRLVQDAWEAVQARPGAAETVASATPKFRRYEVEAREARSRDDAARKERRGRKDQKPEDAESGLRFDDRAVRLLCAGAVDPEESSIDSAPRGWETFARRDALLFHVERLRQDHAANVSSLQRLADDLAGPLGITTTRGRATAAPTLRIATSPPAAAPLKIGDDGTAALAVDVATPEEGVVRSEPPPRGMAFVGMTAPPAGLRIQAEGPEASSDPPGRLEAVGPSAQEGRPVRFTVSQVDLETSATTFKTAAKIFFRGRVDERAAAVVEVQPRSFPSLVLVDISQDPHDLAARFGKGAVDRIEDQFRKHPGEGYMHQGKDAAYVLTFKNVTFRKLTLAYKRTLVDPAGAAQPVPIDTAERELALAPGAAAQVPGKVTSLQTPMGQVRNLTVALRVKESKTAVPDFVVRFRQIDHTSYMVFEEFIRPDTFENVRQDCYVVLFTRRPDDPVREPIKGSELSCTIGEVPGRLSPDYELLPGRSITTTQPYAPGKNQFTWSGRVENEVLPPRKAPAP